MLPPVLEDIFQRRLIWRRWQPAPLKLHRRRRLAQFRLLPPLPQCAQALAQFIFGSRSRPDRLMLLMWLPRRPVWWLGWRRGKGVKGLTRLRAMQWTLIWFLIHQQSTCLKTYFRLNGNSVVNHNPTPGGKDAGAAAPTPAGADSNVYTGGWPALRPHPRGALNEGRAPQQAVSAKERTSFICLLRHSPPGSSGGNESRLTTYG